jgi:hypothetical protein
MLISSLPARIFSPRRYRPGNLGNWTGHLPFAADVIAAIRPSLLVELGTHYGESYFGMCQAVQESGIACTTYAVDTWQGDPHAGYYDESVFEEVNRYNEEHYGAFSKLLRRTFDDALSNFGDETIDLLHIDGLHTYDAIRHDFENWFPKVRPGGVVLLHDTVARHADFQVWKLWEELERRYPHFEFTHNWGLGVVVKPGHSATQSEFLRGLVSASAAEAAFLRHYYALQAIAVDREGVTTPPAPPQAMFQVFPHLENGYTEQTSVRTSIDAGGWQHVRLDLPQGTRGRLRIDPADRPCVVHFAGVVVRRGVDDVIVASWTDAESIAGFTLLGDLVPVPGPNRNWLLSTGRDPRLLLPQLDEMLSDQPLVLETRVRILDDLAAAVSALQSEKTSTEHEAVRLNQQLQTERDSLRTEQARLVAELDASVRRAQQLGAELQNAQAERVALAADYRRVHTINESLVNEAAALTNRLEAETSRCATLGDEAATLRDAQGALTEELQHADAERRQLAADLKIVLESKSWALTAPLRWIVRKVQ